MNLYPAFLTESTFDLEDQLSRLEPVADRIAGVQVDIVDGEFADELTISPIDLIGTNFGSLQVDFHLMVNDPVNFVYECKQVENVHAVIGQIEHMHSQAEFIEECKHFDVKPGLSIDLYTPVDSIDRDSWQHLAVIQIMGNKAGIQGQEFKSDLVLKKIKEVSELKKKLDLPELEIMVDIGVNIQTIDAIADAGATGVAVGSALWESKDIEKTVGQLVG